MLGYAQNELLEFLDGIIGNCPADKAAHVEFGDGDRRRSRAACVILSTKAALARCNAVGETSSPRLSIEITTSPESIPS